MSKTNCMNCKHFFITWDQSAPRGCKLYTIKSRQLPSVIVAASTGEKECLGYQPKKVEKKDSYGD